MLKIFGSFFLSWFNQVAMEFSKSTTSEKLSNEYFLRKTFEFGEILKAHSWSFMVHKSHLSQVVTCMLNAVESQCYDHYDIMLEQKVSEMSSNVKSHVGVHCILEIIG